MEYRGMEIGDGSPDEVFGRRLCEQALAEGAQDVLDLEGVTLDAVCGAVFCWDTYLIMDLRWLLKKSGYDGCAQVIDDWYGYTYGGDDGDPEDYDCVLCGRHFEGVWGNDPWPLAGSGYCCPDCNVRVVRARLARMMEVE